MKVFLLLIFSLTSFVLFAQNDVFSTGNEAYFKKDYPAAIKSYQSLVDDGFESLELFTNLGTSYFQTNKIGKAILFLEKAKLLDKNNPTVVNNLSLANDKIDDEIETISPFFLKAGWDKLYQIFSSNIWAFLALLLVWGSAFFIGKWILNRTRRWKSLAYFAPLLVVAFIAFFAARSAAGFEVDSKMGVVLVTETHLKSGADESSDDILTIHEGLKVDLMDRIGNWYKVRLANGEVGWLLESDVGKI